MGGTTILGNTQVQRSVCCLYLFFRHDFESTWRRPDVFFLQTGSIAEEWSSIITLPPQFLTIFIMIDAAKSTCILIPYYWWFRNPAFTSWYVLDFPFTFGNPASQVGEIARFLNHQQYFPNFEIGKAAFRTKEDEDGLIEVPISVWKATASFVATIWQCSTFSGGNVRGGVTPIPSKSNWVVVSQWFLPFFQKILPLKLLGEKMKNPIWLAHIFVSFLIGWRETTSFLEDHSGTRFSGWMVPWDHRMAGYDPKQPLGVAPGAIYFHQSV